ncbi:centrosomal protein of 152 kDa-like isoform X2 [Periplaneta americana]|uniref:centrosomal protein of 152 kDa-like isoform X2 n=1 Tax=Periplaneta americana TaxID=6978 RepID=UPI0037E6FA9B
MYAYRCLQLILSKKYQCVSSGDLELDTNVQHHEEEEEEEDRKRRNEELHNLLRSEFDDLLGDDTGDDDDISTFNSSSHSPIPVIQENERKAASKMGSHDTSNDSQKQYSNLDGAGDNPEVSAHYTHCFKISPFGDKNEQYRNAEYGSMEQLQVLYDMRVREVHHLAEQLEQEKQKSTREKDQLYRKFALSEAEKERAKQQHTQVTKLLTSSKEKVSELEKEVETLKGNLKNMEESNMKIANELDAVTTSAKDLEQKVCFLERNKFSNADTLLRGLQERHDKEIQNMRNQMESVQAQLRAKVSECDNLHQRLTDLTRTHEAQIVEKTDTINQLMVNLEESQRHCQNLMTKVDNRKIIAEREELEKEMQKLRTELNTARTDLKHYEAVAQFGLLGAEDSDSFVMNHKSSAPSNDLNIRLRDELQRCLAGLQMKRKEIKRLKSQVEDQGRVIEEMKKNTEHSAEVSNLKSELAALKLEKESLKDELLSVRQNNVEEKKRAIDKHSEEYIQWHDQTLVRVRQEAEQQIQSMSADFSIRLKDMQNECDRVKNLYIEVCASKDQLLTALECEQKAKNDLLRHLNLTNEKLKSVQKDLEVEQKKMAKFQNLRQSSDIEELQRAVDCEKERVKALEAELRAAQERDRHYATTVSEEIEKAKLEAMKQFQINYKSTSTMIDAATSPLRSHSDNDELTKVVAALESKHHEELEQVKQESVKCLADELSACEARHRQQLEQAEEEYSRNLATFRGLIDSKTQEVEVLKQAMLEERDKLRSERENCKVTEELLNRTREVELLEKKLKLCDSEWQAKLNAQSSEWKAKLAAYQSDVESERDKMAEAIAGWAEELQTLRKQTEDSERKLLELQSKYQAAKKTARQYKAWADKKEKHVEREWHRITVAFQNALEVLHAKAEAALKDAEGDNPVAKQLEAQIQEVQKKLLHFTQRQKEEDLSPT